MAAEASESRIALRNAAAVAVPREGSPERSALNRQEQLLLLSLLLLLLLLMLLLLLLVVVLPLLLLLLLLQALRHLQIGGKANLLRETSARLWARSTVILLL